MIRVTHLFSSSGKHPVTEQFVRETYLPLLEALPGALRTEAARVTVPPLGSAKIGFIVDQYFADEDAMNKAMVSAAGSRLDRELMSGASLGVEMIVSELMDGTQSASGGEARGAAST